MKLFIVALIALSLLALVNAQCKCFDDVSVPSTTTTVTIGSPTTTGVFAGTDCAANCSTTVTFNGNLDNGLPAGANITLAQCENLLQNNTLYVTDGPPPQPFTSCRAGSFSFDVTSTNVIVFTWTLTTPVKNMILIKPISQVQITTTPPPPPTTPPYTGPLISNPGIARLDLTIGIDTSFPNQAYFNNVNETAQKIASYFTYSNDYVRLSFLTISPFGAGGSGKTPLWGYNKTSLNDDLKGGLPYMPKNNSIYGTVLTTYYFPQISNPPYMPRNNTERIFMVFTGTDAMHEGSLDDVKTEIDKTDMKFIFINMNPAINSSDPNNFLNLRKITGNGSNKQLWYNYQSGQNNAETILDSLYFDGNALCSKPDGEAMSVSVVAAPIIYTLPDSIYYCNYMRNNQIYQRKIGNEIIRVYISSYDLGYNNDFIRISVGGNVVNALTGHFGSAYYCLDYDTVTVTFESNSGLVYGGYKSQVSAFSTLADCQKFTTSAKYIEV